MALGRKHTPFAAQRVGLASELAPLLPWSWKSERLTAAIHA